MEDLALLLQGLIDKVPALGLVLMVLGMLVVVAQTVVLATPSKTDDAAWAKIKAIPVLGHLISLLESFAPIKKK